MDLRSLKTAISRHPVSWALGLLLAALLGVYANSFTGDWHYDDFHHIRENTSIRRLSNIPLFFADATTFSRNPATKMYRPLLMSSHALNHWVALQTTRDGYSVSPYHLLNWLLHLATALTLFALLRFLFTRHPVPGVEPALPALLGALLFGLNPVNVETVVYISSRSAGMSTLFLFLAFWAYLRASRPDTPGVRPLPLAAGTLAFSCALLTKEIAVTLPVLLLLYELLLNRGWMRGLPRGGVLGGLVARLAPFSLVDLAFLGIWQRMVGIDLASQAVSRGGTQAAADLTQQLATQARVWVTYVREWLLPTSLSIDKPFEVSQGFGDPAVLVSLLFLLALGAGLFLGRKHIPLVTFGGAWFFVTLLPESLFRLNVVLNDHRLYLPGLGAALVLTCLAMRFMPRSPKGPGGFHPGALALVLAVLLLLGTGTLHRNAAFQTEESLWRDTLRKNPDSLAALQGLAEIHRQRWEIEESIALLDRAIALEPGLPVLRMNMAAALYDQGRYREAKEALLRALGLDPGHVRTRYNLAKVHLKLMEREEAEAQLREVLRLNPRHPEASFELAGLLQEAGNLEEAEGLYLQALALDPSGMAASHFFLASIRETQGREREALRSYQSYLASGRADPASAAVARKRIEALGKGAKTP